MSNLLLGIRVPNRSYEQLTIENIDLDSKNVLDLKKEISKKINLSSEEIELLYCGEVLVDDKFPSDLNIKSNSLIHVLKKSSKSIERKPLKKIYTKEECIKLAKLFGSITSGTPIETNIRPSIRISILSKIIMEYPEFRRNLGAQAIISDSILFHSLDKTEVVEAVAGSYPIICESAEFIVKTTKKGLVKNFCVLTTRINEIPSSDSTSSSEEEDINLNESAQARIRRITRNEITAAIQALRSSVMAQRNTLLQQQDQGPSLWTSIDPTLLQNALVQALIESLGPEANETSTQEQQQNETPPQNNDIPLVVVSQPNPPESMDATENVQRSIEAPNDDILPCTYRTNQYSNEMRAMRGMGLMNDEINLNVLNITNGNLANAVSLVLTSQLTS